VHTYEDLMRFLGDYVKLDDILWLLSDSEVHSYGQVIISFNTNSKVVLGVNVIFTHRLGGGLEDVRVEFLISTDISASKFLSSQYTDLIKSGAEVLVKKEGISVFYRVKSLGNTSLKQYVDNVCKILEIDSINLSFLKYSFLEGLNAG